MKKIFKSNLLLLLLTIVWNACEMDSNLDPIGNWTISEPVLRDLPTGIVLDDFTASEQIQFSWDPAVASNRFIVSYKLYLMPRDSEDYEDALLELVPASSGRALTVSTSPDAINYALWAACYPANEAAELDLVLVAKAIEKTSIARQSLSVRPFSANYQPSTMFVSGEGSEKGGSPTDAIAMRSVTKSDGTATGVFEAYLTLHAGQEVFFRDRAIIGSRKFGGDDGVLEACGAGLEVEETAQYRVQVDLTKNTYTLTKIERWSLVGDAVEGGWGGDVPLAYQGNGLWSADLELFRPYDNAGFLFRANGDWGLLLKRIVGTQIANNLGGNLAMETDAGNLGFEIEDVPGVEPGNYKVNLNLAAGAFHYRLERNQTSPPVTDNNAVIGKTSNPNGDAVSGSFDIGDTEIPSQLFLIPEGGTAIPLKGNGNAFTSEGHLALEAGKVYYLNDQADGTGQNYITEGQGRITVERDQAYLINVNFETKKFNWKYYNIKVFHWDDANNGWDDRDEIVMNYVHPYKYQVTASLEARFDIKLNSPWDVEFGTDSSQLTGTMVNKGPNFKGITASGTYRVEIVVEPDFASCTYQFVRQ
ncbi:hypothetical protein MM239_05350 [Belliella sp. DSM 111904]|uniref:SusE outer membrane protein n=1 Tax=Belliella filtrata TaxID=2923435 RepID=A0ABS9UXD1_9BACT|nr:hypothetical protein [Belliella filtrata]MCH7408812.1 hypothetical protein [Belliella filtrata]